MNHKQRKVNFSSSLVYVLYILHGNNIVSSIHQVAHDQEPNIKNANKNEYISWE